MARKRKPILQKSEDNKMEENIFETVFEPEYPVEPQPIYSVQVTHSSLRKRVAPNLQAEIAGYIQDRGTYEIFDEVNGWGKLKDGNWIMLTYTERKF